MADTIEEPVEPATPTPNALQHVRFVTYLPDGSLDNCLLQFPSDEQAARMIVVDEVIAASWPLYRANEARDGVEPIPPASPALPPASPPVPVSVTRRQARQALLLAGLLDEVPAAIAQLDDGTPEGKQQMRLAQIEWEDSLEFERARPLVVEIGAAIGLDEAALDALFLTAAGL
jgi:hypothetical protein